MSTVDETVSKVDQGLQEMGIGSVKESIKDILDFKQYLQDQIPAVTGFCIKVVLSIIVFFVGRKIIHWLLKIMRRSLERANVDAGVVQFASSAGKAIPSNHQHCSEPWGKRVISSGFTGNCRCNSWSGTAGRACKPGRRCSPAFV